MTQHIEATQHIGAGSQTLWARRLKVEGAFELTPAVYRDDRGLFCSPFQEPGLVATVGHGLFPVAQSNHSVSRRGVVRGVHFTVTPPGSAKYIYCAHGRALDMVVDTRVGSSTFGHWDAVLLDQVGFRATYLPVGVGHAFVALDDDTVMAFLVSSSYVAEHELALSALDPELGLPIPTDTEPVISDRDLVAPTLAEAERLGMLPSYDRCLEVEKGLYA